MILFLLTIHLQRNYSMGKTSGHGISLVMWWVTRPAVIARFNLQQRSLSNSLSFRWDHGKSRNLALLITRNNGAGDGHMVFDRCERSVPLWLDAIDVHQTPNQLCHDLAFNGTPTQSSVDKAQVQYTEEALGVFQSDQSLSEKSSLI